MPSTLHEALVLLFRESPRLAPMLLARALGVELPAGADVQVTSAEFAELDPSEYRADVVLRVPDQDDRTATARRKRCSSSRCSSSPIRAGTAGRTGWVGVGAGHWARS